jgi:hypothetical protein
MLLPRYGDIEVAAELIGYPRKQYTTTWNGDRARRKRHIGKDWRVKWVLVLNRVICDRNRAKDTNDEQYGNELISKGNLGMVPNAHLWRLTA